MRILRAILEEERSKNGVSKGKAVGVGLGVGAVGAAGGAAVTDKSYDDYEKLMTKFSDKAKADIAAKASSFLSEITNSTVSKGKAAAGALAAGAVGAGVGAAAIDKSYDNYDKLMGKLTDKANADEEAGINPRVVDIVRHVEKMHKNTDVNLEDRSTSIISVGTLVYEDSVAKAVQSPATKAMINMIQEQEQINAA